MLSNSYKLLGNTPLITPDSIWPELALTCFMPWNTLYFPRIICVFSFPCKTTIYLFKKPRIPSLPESSLHLLLNSQSVGALSNQEVLLITPNTRPPNVLTVCKGISPFLLASFSCHHLMLLQWESNVMQRFWRHRQIHIPSFLLLHQDI